MSSLVAPRRASIVDRRESMYELISQRPSMRAILPQLINSPYSRGNNNSKKLTFMGSYSANSAGRSSFLKPGMADSGVASPTNEMEHFPTLDERARSSTRAMAKSGRLSPTHSASGSLIRASIIKLQGEKKAKKVKFYRNGDRYFRGMVYAVSPERFRMFESLLAELTESPLGDRTVLPNGVRHIFSMDGMKKITDIEQLEEDEHYVCASTAMFKKIDYPKSLTPVWNTNAMPLKDAIDEKGSVALRYDVDENKEFIYPKLITVIRNGSKPRKAVRMLLNRKTAHSFAQVMNDMTEAIKLDSGAVRKIFTLDGRPIITLQDFFGDDNTFLAYGAERYSLDDFDLEDNEIRFVSAYRSVRNKERICLKSPKMVRRGLGSANSVHRDPHQSPSSPVRSMGAMSPGSPRRQFGSGRSKSPGRISRHSPSNENVLEAPPKLMVKYRIGKVIGEGNFAQVRECTNKVKKTQYALKIISKAKCKGREQMIENEVGILRQVKHDNIIQLLEDYDGGRELYLVMELVKGGDLFEAISSATKYTERDASGMVYNLASALKYLHAHNIVHRDIKPENILVCELENGGKALKLGDFGLATEVTEPLYTVCGTPTYVAPEIIGETGYGLKIDVWSMGVITYILLCGFPPFVSADNDQEELFDKVTSGEYTFMAPYWDDISHEAKELISMMLQVDPDARCTAAEVADHPWVAAADIARDDDLIISGKLRKNFSNKRKIQGQPGVALLASTALDKASRFFQGRKNMPLQEYNNGHSQHQEVF